MRKKNFRSCSSTVERPVKNSKNNSSTNREMTDKENIPVISKRNKKNISSVKTNTEICPNTTTSSAKDNIQLLEPKVSAVLKENKNVLQRSKKRRIASHDDAYIKSTRSPKEHFTEKNKLKSVSEKPEDLTAVAECVQVIKSAESVEKDINCDDKSDDQNKRKPRSGSNQKRIKKNLTTDDKSAVPELKYNTRKRVNTKENGAEVPVAPSKKPKKVPRKDVSVNLKNNISKKSEKPVGRISKVNFENSKARNCTNKSRFSQMKCVKTDIEVKNTNNVPIYKKDCLINKPTKGVKRPKIVDVYDMDLDEDLIISSENEMQRKKKNCSTSKGKKVYNRSKKFGPKKKDCQVKSSKSGKTKPKLMKEPVVDVKVTDNVDIIEQLVENDKSDVALNLPKSSEVDLRMRSVEAVVSTDLIQDIDNNEIESNIILEPVGSEVEMCEEQNFNNIDSSTLECTKVTDAGSVENNTNLDPHIFVVPSDKLYNNNKVPGKEYMSILADELERSFMIPTLTSTPFKHPKKGPKAQKRKIIDISEIPVVNNHSNLTENMPDPLINDVNIADTVDKEITLFESPSKPKEEQKKEGKKLKSPKKTLQLNLFGDFLNSPSKPQDLNESVSKPKKIYDTPDTFKLHLARTKRTAPYKKARKSKQDIFIEKMAEHFDEIESLELCVE